MTDATGSDATTGQADPGAGAGEGVPGQPGAFPPGSYVVWATVTVREDALEDFLAGIAADARDSLANEPGCLGFTVNRHADDPLRFSFHEVYADREAFEAGHQGAPHFAAWREVAERTVTSTEIVFSEVVALP